MIISTTTRRVVSASVVGLAAAALTACGDVDAPTAAPRAPSAASADHYIGYTSVSITSGGTSIVSSSGSGSSGSTVTVTVYPTTSVTMTIGNHKLRLPAGTICDPATSGYGATEWDKPCTRSSGPVTITARASTNSSGHARVDFSPALRFQPNGAGQVVTLYLLDKRAAETGGFTIEYCADGALACVDEALTDSSVATRTDASTGYLYRRLKHFSGYSIGVGRGADY